MYHPGENLNLPSYKFCPFRHWYIIYVATIRACLEVAATDSNWYHLLEGSQHPLTPSQQHFRDSIPDNPHKFCEDKTHIRHTDSVLTPYIQTNTYNRSRLRASSSKCMYPVFRKRCRTGW